MQDVHLLDERRTSYCSKMYVFIEEQLGVITKELRHLEGGPKVMSLKTLGAPAKDLRRSDGRPKAFQRSTYGTN